VTNAQQHSNITGVNFMPAAEDPNEQGGWINATEMQIQKWKVSVD
jgi:hypothetical protein